jgi:predicted nucleic acid-binding protein
MKVADSSYVIEGILRDAALLEHEVLISPDLVLYEVVNTLWKHETLIGDLKGAQQRIDMLLGLVSNQRIQLVRPDKRLLDETYALSIKHRLPIYDSVFVALALQLKTELATFDSRQSKVLTEAK